MRLRMEFWQEVGRGLWNAEVAVPGAREVLLGASESQNYAISRKLPKLWFYHVFLERSSLTSVFYWMKAMDYQDQDIHTDWHNMSSCVCLVYYRS